MLNLKEFIQSLKAFLTTQNESSSRRKFPRVTLPESRLRFKKNKSRSLTIANCSKSGIAFFRSEFTSHLKIGDEFLGTLFVDSIPFSVRCVIVQLNAQIVGCEFKDINIKFELAMIKAFEIEMRAHDMKEVSDNTISAPSPGTPFYFRGGSSEELFFVFISERIPYFILIFDNQVVTGGYKKPIKTGYLNPEINQEASDLKARYPFIEHDRVNNSLLSQSLIFLNNLDQLSKDHLHILKNYIRLSRQY